MDQRCYDLFSVIFEGGDRTAIYQNTISEPTLLHSRQVGQLVNFSPLLALLGIRLPAEWQSAYCIGFVSLFVVINPVHAILFEEKPSVSVSKTIAWAGYIDQSYFTLDQ